MRVLVVEDDRALGMFVKKGLEMDGHSVDWLGDGDEAFARAVEQQPDLMVLDLGLPGRDGTDVLAELSEGFPQTSVLVLTGRSDVQERVRCLNLGADDCLLKPFSLHELIARCRAILRRKGRFADAVLRCGGLEVNRMDRVVRRDGLEIELTGKEFGLLEYLLRHSNTCCTRAELLEHVWNMPADTVTNVVDVYINYLRRKLTVSPDYKRSTDAVIETVRGQGYCLRSVSARKPAASVTSIEIGKLPKSA